MAEAHTARVHARLAPSAAHRWIECPGSIRMSEGIDGKSSSYAAEGTAAHELASYCLTNGRDPAEFLGGVIDIERTGPDGPFACGVDSVPDHERFFDIDEEMVEGVQLYIDTVESLLPIDGPFEFDVEQRLDMTHIHPGIFGTGDAVIYQIDAGWLHVVDLKYGKGVAVNPGENPQLMTYGAGAAKRHHNRVLNGITLWIVQPRAEHSRGPVRSWSTDPLTLMEFEDVLGRAALATESPDAPLLAGDWCRFCPALAICPAARQRSLDTAVSESQDNDVAPPNLMSSEALAKVLREAEYIGNWVKAVQVYAHAEAVAGRIPTGFKLVAKQARRRWKDAGEAEGTLLGWSDMVNIYSEPELLSPAQIEKQMGKKRFAALADLVTKVSSGTNLVSESDVRPSVKADAEKEFAE